MKRLILLLLLSLPMLSIAQNYTVRGAVVDSARHEPLFYVRVGLVTPDSAMKTVAVTFTDADGNFTLDDVPAGRYNLMAFIVGYAPVTRAVRCEGDNPVVEMGRIALRKEKNTLQEVSITGEKPLFLVEGEKTMYNVSEDPTIQDGTASDALQNTPGVEVDIEGNITLHGASSVDVWLNDKPSNLSADNLKNFIQQLPANSLDRIEVINNPSAKYNTDADAIINIILLGNIKKNSFISFGITGSSKPEVKPWISYVWANEKLSLNFYLNGSYSFSRSMSEAAAVRFNADGDTSSNGHGISQSRQNNYSGSFNFNGSYTFDTANTINFWAGTYPGWGKSLSSSNTLRREYIDNPGVYAYNTTYSSRSVNAGAYGGLFYKHTFRKPQHDIRVNFSGNYNYGHSLSDNIRDYMLQDYLDFFKNNLSHSNSYSLRGSVDYNYPYSKNGELSAGVDGSFRDENSLTTVDTLVAGSDGLFQLDSLRLRDTRTLNSGCGAYLTLQHKFGNFTLKGGLRLRYNHEDYRIFNSPEDNVVQDYVNLLPSLHLSYRTKSMHNLRLGYTYRVNNSGASRMTTFTSYSDDSFWTGNPDLQPTHTHNVDFNWTKFFKKFGNVGLTAYFKHTDNKISTLTDVVYDEHFGRIVTFTTPVNAGRSLNTGMSMNVNYRLKSFMSLRFYASVYYDHSVYQFRHEAVAREFSNVGYSFRLNYWAKLWKVLEVFASANYRSKSVTLFNTSRPRYSIDCGLRADLFKRQLSVHLNVTDIFNWNKTGSTENNPYYHYVSSTKYNSRFISAGVTFRFGKMELEKKATENSDVETSED